MSDDDFMMSDEDSYEFEYEDDDDVMEEDQDNQNFDLENKYYSAKSLKEDDIPAALEEFQTISDSEQTEENIEWIFKAYKQMMKINFKEFKNFDKSIKTFEKLIAISSKVNKSYSEESLNKILTNYSNCSDPNFKAKLYELTLNYLNESGNSNDRLWLKININRLNILLDTNQLVDCVELINQVNSRLQTVSTTTRTTYSLEIVAIEIQYYSKTGEYSKLKDLYKRAISINSAVPHPRIMGIVKEAGGKMFFRSQNYTKARIEFYESFKNYDEAGSPSKITILKYLTLCSILTETEVNPFEAKETQIYSQMPEFQYLIKLIECYDSNDLDSFNHSIEKMVSLGDSLVTDDIFKTSIDKIRYNLRSNIIVNLFTSYNRLKFEYLERKLYQDKFEIEDIILTLVSDGKLSNVKLDFIDNCIEIGPSQCKINPLISTSEIYANLKCLNDVGADNGIQSRAAFNLDKDGDSVMDSPVTTAGSNADDAPLTTRKQISLEYGSDKMKNILNIKEKSSVEDIMKAVENWSKMVETGLPIKVKSELSQKDQIALEQRTNTKVEDGDDEEDEKKDKLSTLTEWYQEIKIYQDNLLRK